MLVRTAITAALLVVAAAAQAQSPTPGGMPPPPGMSLAQSAAMRFPQPVRVGDLPGRAVLEPVEAQTMLGRVRAIVKDGTGAILVVVELKSWFGLNNRVVAIPVDAMVLVGDTLEAVAYTPAQLWTLPRFDLSSATALGDDAVIRVGLAKPSH